MQNIRLLTLAAKLFRDSFLLSIGAALATSIALAQTPATARSQNLFGEWWTPGFSARVRLERCGEAVCGHIVWLWDEAPGDIADKRPLVGRKIIDGMLPEAPSRWNGGWLYNPEDGRDYKGSLELQSANRLVLKGCVLFVCRSQVWRRYDPRRVPPVAAI